MNNKSNKNIIIILITTLVSSILVAFYFYLFPPKTLEQHVPHGSNEILERNYDGPIYVVLSKTFYNPQELKNIGFNKLPPIYFANHFPLMPFFIKVVSFLTKDSFRALILITWLSTAGFAIVFYKFLQKFEITDKPLLLTLVSLFIPPRMLAIRTVGGTETLFMLILFSMLYLWWDKKYLSASVLSILLVLTRPPGIWLVIGFLGIIVFEYIKENKGKYTAAFYFKKLKNLKKLLILMLMPLTILGLFLFYQYNFGDFLAYFKTNTGTNIHFTPIPFAATINSNTPAVEGFIYLLIVYAVGVYLLWKQGQKRLAILSFVYLLPNFFMYVDDIHRYLIPIAPLVLIVNPCFC
jgi:Gpi18-like mannosyltransferase